MKHGMEIAVVAIIIIFACVFLFQDSAGDKSWEGADGEAAELIESSGYEPWIEPFWEPPSGEIESFLFALQAAIGAVVIGYVFGYWHAGKKTA